MIKQKKNILLISLDTLRADVAYSGKLKFLESCMNEGTAFINAVSQSPLTPVSHASVLTGLLPTHHGIRHLFKEKMNASINTLASTLQREGYSTGAVVSCPGLNKWYGFDRGFSSYDDEIPLLADGTNPLETVDVRLRGTALKRAPVVVDRSLHWLRNSAKTPYFLFMHFFDTHWPYEPPENFAPPGTNCYESEAFYVEHYLSRFFETAKQEGFLENTLIVIFSDHGEDLGGLYSNDHGGELLGHPEEDGHGCLLFDATQLVPLIFIEPELVPKRNKVYTQVRLIDILPTIYDLLEISNLGVYDGVSLRSLFLDSEPDRLAYFETFYREEQNVVSGLSPLKGFRLNNGQKIIFNIQSGEINLYDLKNDPNEKRPIRL